jgi:D-glycero-D-manno-heptose 1,7-bisphosphate phosphatase
LKSYKIAFLDRDGIINSKNFNNGYIGHLKYFKWIPGARKSISFLKKKGYKVVVVSNQSGVARGFFKLSDVKKIHSYIQSKLKLINTKLDGFFFCPYHKDGILKKFRKDSSLRKPKIGLFNLVQRKWKVDKKKSFIIGDQITDMQFGKKSGIRYYLFDENKDFNLYYYILDKVIK